MSQQTIFLKLVFIASRTKNLLAIKPRLNGLNPRLIMDSKLKLPNFFIIDKISASVGFTCVQTKQPHSEIHVPQ